MYERTCYQKLDEPIVVWMGVEYREVVMAVAAGFATGLVTALFLGFVGLFVGFAVGAGMLSLFRYLHKGGPGYVFTRIYRKGLLEFLPPGIRPRHLLPIPPEARGRNGRFRLSPVSSKDPADGAEDARKYFGR